MKTEIKTERNIEVFKVSGTLDMLTVPVFKQQVTDLLKNGRNRIIFDFADLEFVNSSGLEVLISNHVTAKKAGGFIAIAAVSANVAKVFEITRMDRAFKIFPDSGTAIEALAE